MSRWFSVISFESRKLQKYLDLLVFLANPQEKNWAHITVQGPYEAPKELSGLSQNVVGAEISILGTGNFFKNDQNTVYFHCGSGLFEEIWDKPKTANCPHITIYDGGDRVFAKRLHGVLSHYRFFGVVFAGGIHSIRSMRGQSSFDLLFEADDTEISDLLGRGVSIEEARKLPDWERLMVIDRLATRLDYVISDGRRLRPN